MALSIRLHHMHMTTHEQKRQNEAPNRQILK